MPGGVSLMPLGVLKRAAAPVPRSSLRVLLAADLKSGPQKPTVVVKAFNTLHCNGEGTGTKACLV